MLVAFARFFFSSSSNQNHAYLSYPRLHCMQITDDVRLRGPTLRYSVPLSAYILSSRINAVPTWFTCVALVGPSWVIRRIFSPIYRLKPSTHTRDGRALRGDGTRQRRNRGELEKEYWKEAASSAATSWKLSPETHAHVRRCMNGYCTGIRRLSRVVSLVNLSANTLTGAAFLSTKILEFTFF